jgi:hypothetical protein
MRVNHCAGKVTSGMDKFGSVIDRMNMKLGSKFLNFLRIKTQVLKRLQCVNVVDGAPTPKRMVWRVTEAPWRMKHRYLCCSCVVLSCNCGLVKVG